MHAQEQGSRGDEKNRDNPKVCVGLGELLWDIYPNGKCLGGAPANFAVHVQRIGERGVIVSRVGSDRNGEEIVERLRTQGVETRWIQLDEKYPTGTVRVMLNALGIPSFECSREVAFDYLLHDDRWGDLINAIDALFFGSLAQRTQSARNTIQEFVSSVHPALTIYDINIRGWSSDTKKIALSSFALANMIKVNEPECSILQDYFGKRGKSPLELFSFLLNEFNIRIAALTLGAQGCLLFDGEVAVYSPGYDVKVIDTTGAGDAFAAGFAVRFLQDNDLRSAAEFANGVGALIASKKGATPDWEAGELHALMSAGIERIYAGEFREFA